MTPTLFTLTGNLLWQHNLDYTSWAPGKTQRAQSLSFQVGGKGINVSRMLMRLGAPTRALCFAGGSSGQDCLAWMKAREIPVTCFATSRATRVGVVVRSPQQPETTFFGPDVAPDPNAWIQCAACIRDLPADSLLALCGSFPGWDSPDAEPLRTAITEYAGRAPLVVDSYGPPLRWALSQPAALIKINREEFDAHVSPQNDARDFPSRLGDACRSFRPAAWIVSDGAEPVWLASRTITPKSFPPPKVEVVSPTGSGDILLACLLHAHFQQGRNLEDSLAFALPYASANAAHPGIADFDLNLLPR